MESGSDKVRQGWHCRSAVAGLLSGAAGREKHMKESLALEERGLSALNFFRTLCL